MKLPDGVSSLESNPVGDLSVLFNFLAKSFLQFESFDWTLHWFFCYFKKKECLPF